MKKILCFLLVTGMCLGISGCNLGKDVSTETQIDLSGMTQFTVEGEYSICYKEGWTPMSINTLRLIKGDSAFLMGDSDITEGSAFKSKKASEQLEYFYKRMVEYVEFVENTPSEGVTLKSLGFEKSNVYSVNENCIAVAPFKTSDGRVVVYLVALDRKTNLLARLSYTTNEETTYLGEIDEVRGMFGTLRMDGVTTKKIAIPDFSNIEGLTPELMTSLYGEPVDAQEKNLVKEDGNVMHMLHYQYDNLNFTFADGILGGVYVQPGGVIFENLDSTTAEQVSGVLEKYGIVIIQEVSVMQKMERQPDGQLLTTTKLVGWGSNSGEVTDKIKSVELQETAFRVIYNEELFELIYAAVVDEGIPTN